MLRAESLGANVIALFPKGAKEFGYADLKQARKLSWMKQFEEQTLPASYAEFQDFLRSVGINPDTQINQLAWSLGAASGDKPGALPEMTDMIGVLAGTFDSQALDTFYSAHHLRTVQRQGHTVYVCGNETTCQNVYFYFVDSSTIAFGSMKALATVMANFSGEQANLGDDRQFLDLARGVNHGDVAFWGVLSGAASRKAITQLLPASAQFPQADELFKNVNSVLVSVESSDNLDASFRVIADSPQIAATLQQLLQAGLLLQQYRIAQSDPDIAKLLDSAQLAQEGNALIVSLSASSDQIAAMVKRNMFLM